MILDGNQHAHLYTEAHPLFGKAFDFLKTTDFSKLSFGRHAIDGDKLFALYMEYETKSMEECVMESHRKYIDIQCMIEGEESMAITTFNGQPATTAYDEEKDVAFYEKRYESLITVRKNHFVIFFPHDLHMPCIQTGERKHVKKVVFKVNVVS
jgi:YhcH/YjgK/YiaL family protein